MVKFNVSHLISEKVDLHPGKTNPDGLPIINLGSDDDGHGFTITSVGNDRDGGIPEIWHPEVLGKLLYGWPLVFRHPRMEVG